MFRNVGTPIKEGMVQAFAVGPDKYGNRNTIYFSISQCEDSVLFLKYNADTRELRQYRAHNDPDVNSKMGAWGITVFGNESVYLGTYYQGHLLKYDIQRDEFVDLGQAVKGEEYVLTLCSDGNTVYGGTYPGGKIFAVDPGTNQVTDLEGLDSGALYCRLLKTREDGSIIATVGTKEGKIAVYSPRSGSKTVISFPEPGAGNPIIHEVDGEVYAKLPNAGEVYQVAGNELVYFASELPEEKHLLSDGRKLISVSDKEFVIENAAGNQEVHPYRYESGGLMLWMAHKGPDNNIYGSSALPLRMFRYDPLTGACVNLGNPTTTNCQIYSMVNLGERIYMGSYPGAVITEYDPTKPWDFGKNPKDIGRLAFGQNRPTSMVLGPDNRIYIASVPDYGQTSGALSRLDPNTGTITVWRGVVDEQSVYVVDSIAGTRLICAATTNEVGTGETAPTTDARVFLWDVDQSVKVREFYPVPGAETIVSVKHRGGIVYGLTRNGVLFAYDYVQDQLLWRKELPIKQAILPGMDITYDNMIYGAGDNKLFRYDPAKDEFSIVAETTGWVIGFHMDKENRKIYATPGARLLCYDIEQEERLE